MKVHFMGSGNVRSPGSTACGIDAWPTTMKDEYDTADCRRIEAVHKDWNGVTCGRCLRNRHSPQSKARRALTAGETTAKGDEK